MGGSQSALVAIWTVMALSVLVVKCPLQLSSSRVLFLISYPECLAES